MSNNHTRGEGLLESFLSKKRTKIINNLIPKVKRKGSILDIGCGSYPYFLTKTNFKHKYGLDASLTTTKLGNINLIKQNLKNDNLPFADNQFDIVTMLAVFEHIDPAKIPHLLKEINRILKPKGNFILTTPTPLGNFILKIMVLFKLVSKEEIDDHKKIYSNNDLKNLLEEHNYQKIKAGHFEFNLNNWAFCQTKK